MTSLQRLSSYCISQAYEGWDLFDGLNSLLFKHSPISSSDLCQLAWIQLFKRSPINFRPITLVPKGYNAKGLGLFVSGLVAQKRLPEARQLLDRLLLMKCSGYAGMSWGYNFPWMARAFYVPEGKPNIVTTVFVANAFLDYADRIGDAEEAKRCLEVADQCCQFILQELVIFEDNQTLCFGYIPGEPARVYNASMLGAALLGRVYAINKRVEYLEKSRKAMLYAVRALNPDYSWPYGELSHHKFIDNFHTGFNLVALKTWMDATGENQWLNELKQAYAYYLNTFWQADGSPKYYNNSLYPIDVHCSAQGIVTCLKLMEYDDRSKAMADKIAEWVVNNMQDEQGYFYYQKHRFYTNKIPYIRWAQAWMFHALSLYTGNEQLIDTTKIMEGLNAQN